MSSAYFNVTIECDITLERDDIVERDKRKIARKRTTTFQLLGPLAELRGQKSLADKQILGNS